MPKATGTRRSVGIAGAQLAYQHRAAAAGGQFDPVILLHPWFGCWQFWRHTVDALPWWDTYAVDLYSLGAGSGWEQFASPEGLARAVGMMMDALDIARCSIIGNSMGGIAAQILAAARPAQVAKLVLVGTGARIAGVKPSFRRALDGWIAGEATREATEQLVGSLLARLPEDREEFRMFVEMVLNASKPFMTSVLTNAFGLDLRPRLTEIAAGTLVIRGERDAARTQAHVAELLAGIPNSTATEIPDAGHSPQVDSPQAFARLVREFLLP